MLFNIWVTNACNFRCEYCYVPQYENNIDHVTADNIINFIEKSVYNTEDEIIINFHGGEPLLNYKIIRYIVESANKKLADKKVLYGMTTNGFLLTEDISKFIAKNFKYNLSISLDGTKEVNDLNRKFINKQGTYDSVIEKFLYLKKLEPDVRVRITYNPDTVSYLFESVQHIVKLGFRNIVAVADYSDNNWNDTHVDELSRELTSIFELYANDNSVDINFISDDITRKKGRCNGGKTSINININGDIYPCTWTVGNKDFKIGDIYKGIMTDEVEKLLEHSLILNEECNGCGLYAACIGNRCRMINKVITNDYNKVPVFRCEYNRLIYRLQKNRKWEVK